MLKTRLFVIGATAAALTGCDSKPATQDTPAAPSTSSGSDSTATGTSAAQTATKTESKPAAAAPKLSGDQVVATVNGVQISKDRFEKELAKFPEQIRSTPHGRKYVLDNLVEQTLLVAEAEKRGIDEKPDFVRMMDDYKRRTLKDVILQDLTGEKKEITEADLKKYFDEHPEQFDRPAMVRASHILVDTEAEARKAAAAVKGGQDFKEVAKKMSKDPYASATGGDLGWFSQEQRPEYAEKVFALKNKNDVTAPVQTSRGWHVFMLVDRRPPEKKTFAEAKETLRRRLESQDRSKTYRDFIAQLKDSATVDVNDGIVNAGVEKPEGAPGAIPAAGGDAAPGGGDAVPAAGGDQGGADEGGEE